MTNIYINNSPPPPSGKSWLRPWVPRSYSTEETTLPPPVTASQAPTPQTNNGNQEQTNYNQTNLDAED